LIPDPGLFSGEDISAYELGLSIEDPLILGGILFLSLPFNTVSGLIANLT